MGIHLLCSVRPVMRVLLFVGIITCSNQSERIKLPRLPAFAFLCTERVFLISRRSVMSIVSRRIGVQPVTSMDTGLWPAEQQWHAGACLTYERP
ncbi:hypothetical protein Poly21_11520 [Allorhodopirellula heiligendammensis]|uniref:Uncharacterized protein n=1 Tax=Allorhodopirellula heiligendammensis TaxID=2714739 RepID=A0A5C6C652_9BACT|nr:hypothetical protein Poly21_11520 [Allorhodopirellula heiligendammensis]